MPKPPSPLNDVPEYEIYGHSCQKSATDFLHIESLRDTQKKHDRTIRPHRHLDLTQFLFVERGAGKIQLGDNENAVTAPSIIIIPANEIHAFSMERDIDGYQIAIADSFLRDFALKVREPSIDLGWNSPMIITLNQTQYANMGIDRLINDLIVEFTEQREARSVAIYAYLNLILTSVIRSARISQTMNKKTPENKNLGILHQFRHLCDERFRKSKTVSEYCIDLNVTERTLRRITQQYLGIPPLQVIHDRLLLEAQRNLIYSTASISSIAESLGFDDPAYFTRFFKRHMQQTPNQFRTSKLKKHPTTNEA